MTCDSSIEKNESVLLLVNEKKDAEGATQKLEFKSKLSIIKNTYVGTLL